MSRKPAECFINTRQAARLADCGEAYIYDRIRQQSFASERIAGRLLIDEKSFLAWLEGYRIRRHRQPEKIAIAEADRSATP
jgi:hypothetical protein